MNFMVWMTELKSADLRIGYYNGAAPICEQFDESLSGKTM